MAVDWDATLGTVVPYALFAVSATSAFLALRGIKARLSARAVAEPPKADRPKVEPATVEPAKAELPGPAPAVAMPPSTIAPPESTPVAVPRIAYDEDAEHDDEATVLGETTAPAAPAKIFYEEDAFIDEPTGAQPLIAITATAQSDKGRRRTRNEDRVLAMERQGIFAVADGMGGIRGGEIASSLAVDALRTAFERNQFDAESPRDLPRRAAELASAIASANRMVLARAREQRELKGMGTTLAVARFAAHKQRLYIGHVGDSRVYRLRRGRLVQLTTDHTMDELGVEGDEAKNLSRALGIWPRVGIDIFLAKPLPDDLYLLCSDGLTKMVDEARITRLLMEGHDIHQTARSLVDAANECGGADNVSVVLVRVEAPRLFARGA
jgi:PPM family protein phosphatase